ncbi:glycosyltransferase, family 1 [alpha proteobacterium HIMB59]|nr:glycosyltransferase, family 1 [alpha proteobacterium HIMB59]
MKILVIIPSFYPYIENGGPIIYLNKLFKKLSSNKINITVLTSKYSYTNKEHKIKSALNINKNYEVKYYPITFGKVSIKLCYSIIKEINKYDYVYFNSFFNIYLITTLLFSNKKIFLSPRGQLIAENIKKKNHFIKYLFIKIINIFDKKIFYIFSSNFELINNLYSKIYKYELIPNSASYEPIKVTQDIFRKKSKFKTKKILTISRLSKRKNIDLILKAAAILRNFYFEIIGPDFGQLNQLFDQVEKNKLKNVTIIESLTTEQIRKKFIESYIFLLPSENENFGNVFLESILHFVPIITIRGSYWDEIIKQNNVGLSTKKCEKDIVLKIKQLDNLYATLKLNEFKNVQKIHNTEMISNKFLKTFHANC